MQYNPGDGSGVVDEINDICKSDDQSYPLTSKTRRTNTALDRFFTLAFESDGRWNFDDMNQSDAPIQSIALANGQQEYAIDEFAYEIINALRWEITDANGNKTQLRRLNRNRLQGSLREYQAINGTPKEYDLIGKYIYLYPAPDFDAEDALTVYFERNKVSINADDTEVTLGIPSIFHTYIGRHASLPYLIENGKGEKNDVATQIQADEAAIRTHFNRREKGVRNNMSAQIESTK